MTAWLDLVKKTKAENPSKPLKEILKMASAKYNKPKKAPPPRQRGKGIGFSRLVETDDLPRRRAPVNRWGRRLTDEDFNISATERLIRKPTTRERQIYAALWDYLAPNTPEDLLEELLTSGMSRKEAVLEVYALMNNLQRRPPSPTRVR